MSIARCFVLLSALSLSVGCGMQELAETAQGGGAATEGAGEVTPAATEGAAGGTEPAGESPVYLEPGAGTAASPPSIDADPAPQINLPPGVRPAGSAAKMERVKADVGVGKQGQSLQNEQGIARVIVEPAKALFAFKQRAVFQIQIPQALQLYKATNGDVPQSQEEFDREIIQFNNIKLPELPAGQRYVYDPKRGELMVERPADK